MDQSAGGTWKWVFEYFEIQKWMLQAVREGKVDEKKCDHLSSFHDPFLSYGP